MSERKFEILQPFGGLHGISFYSAQRQTTSDGYKETRLSYDYFNWEWYVSRKTGQCVKSVILKHPVRVLGSPVEKEKSAVHDYPEKHRMVHDLSRVWAMTLDDFVKEFVSVDWMIEALCSSGRMG